MKTAPRKTARATRSDGVGLFTKGRKSPMTPTESRALLAPGPAPAIPGWMIAALDESAWKMLVKGSETPRRFATPKNVCPECRMARASSTGACFC